MEAERAASCGLPTRHFREGVRAISDFGKNVKRRTVPTWLFLRNLLGRSFEAFFDREELQENSKSEHKMLKTDSKFRSTVVLKITKTKISNNSP